MNRPVVLYKRNPAFRTPIGVEGISLDEDAVVCGDNFKQWAENKTPKGPFLVVVAESDLTDAQRQSLENFTARLRGLPPRHLGAIKSDAFKNRDEGLEIRHFNTVDSIVAPIPVPETLVEEEKKEVKVTVTGESNEGNKLEDAGNDLLCQIVPGVTASNVEKFKLLFVTFERLANASNTEMRSVGIRSNLFSKVREAAKNFISKKD